MPGHRLATALLVALALPACSHKSPESAAADDRPHAVVRVTNYSMYDMDIYIVRQAASLVRIGSVTSQGTADMIISPSLVAGPTSVRFVARPYPRRGAEVSQTIYVTPGDTVKMTILR